MRPNVIISRFQHYFSLHQNAFPYAIELIEKRDNYVSYKFENINEAISLSIVVSPYIEVMICFDDKEGNNLDHLVLHFEPCFSSTLLERALQVSVEYMKCNFLPTFFLVSRLTSSYSYAEIVSQEKLFMYNDDHIKTPVVNLNNPLNGD